MTKLVAKRGIEKLLVHIVLISLLALMVFAAAPTHSNPEITAATVFNTTIDDLTASNISTVDTDGDDVKNFYVWFIDGGPFTTMYVPMEANGTLNGTLDIATGEELTESSSPAFSAILGHDGRGAYNFSDGGFLQLSPPIPSRVNFTYDESFTIDTWILIHNDQFLNVAAAYDKPSKEGWGLFVNNLEVQLTLGDGSTEYDVATDALLQDQWYHITAVYNSESFTQLYVNGKLNSTYILAEDGFSEFVPSTNQPFMLGGGGPGTGSILMSEFRIWDGTMGPEQVLNLYNNEENILIGTEMLADGDAFSVAVLPHDKTADGYGALQFSDNLTINANSVPTIGVPVLNATDGLLNNTRKNLNLTVYVPGVTDTESHSTKTIVNWDTTGQDNMVILNMPFETNSDFDEDVSIDYSTFENHNGMAVEGATHDANGGHDGFGAFRFYGSEESYMDIADASHINSTQENMTISCWFNTETLKFGDGDSAKILERVDGSDLGYSFGFMRDDAKSINGLAFTQTGASTVDYDKANFARNTWYQAVVTHDGAWTALYVNGAVVDKVTNTNRVPMGDSMITLGDSFTGLIDDCMILNRTVSPQQVASWYDNGVTTIVAEETNAGEDWEANVTVFDIGGTSASVLAEPITLVSNTVPNAVSLAITSTSPRNTTLDNITATYTFSDPDGLDSEDLVEILWYNSSSDEMEEVTTLANQTTVTDEYLALGENWTFTVRLSDTGGAGWGPFVNTTNYTVATTADLVAPLVNNVTIATLGFNGSAGTNFTFNVSLTDTNFDTVIARIQNPNGNSLQNLTLSTSDSGELRTYNGTFNSAGLDNGLYFIDVFANDTHTNNDEVETTGLFLVEDASNVRATYYNASVAFNSPSLLPVGDMRLNLTIDASSGTVGSVFVVAQATNPTTGSAPLAVDGQQYFTIEMDAASYANFSNATLSFTYNTADFASTADESTIRIYHFNEATGEFEALGNASTNTATNVVEGYTSSFSTFAVFASAPATTTTTSSSSGGGGGSGASASNVYTGQTRDIGLLDPEGSEIIMSERSTIEFTLADGTKHSIYVETIDEDKVSGVFSSDPQDFILNTEETKTYDLDGDGEIDFKATLDQIHRDRAYFTLANPSAADMEAAPTAETISAETEEGELTPEERKQRRYTWAWILIALAVIAILAGWAYHFYHHKKNSF